jgi:hypothetical protein
MILKNTLRLVFLALLITSCSNDRLDADASAVDVKISFRDVRSSIVNSDTDKLISEHSNNKEALGELYDYLIGYCFRIGNVDDSAFVESIMLYRQDTIMRDVEKQIDAKFSTLKDFESNVTTAFQHFKYHLPKRETPEYIVYMNSLFRSNVFCTDKNIGVGLERYLGADNDVIKNLDPTVFFQWVKDGMDPKFMERDVMTAWIETNIIEEEKGNLAERMIRWGKVLYLTEAALPKLDKHLILRYLEKDLEWAKENEPAFWKYLVDQKMLFAMDERNNMNILNPGPTTPGLPREGAPDRLGRYLGWTMVRNYMNEHDEVSMEDMIALPYNTILQEYETE